MTFRFRKRSRLMTSLYVFFGTRDSVFGDFLVGGGHFLSLETLGSTRKDSDCVSGHKNQESSNSQILFVEVGLTKV